MIIEKHDIEWLYSKVDGLKKLVEDRYFPLHYILDAGAYVAGGFIRKLLNDGSTKCVFTHFLKGGDLDVFCYDENQVKAVVESLEKFAVKIQYSELPSYIIYGGSSRRLRWSETHGKHAKQTTINMPGRPRMTIQVIKSKFGNPVTMLKNFDFVNCMVGFTLHNAYIHPEQQALEKSKTLKALRPGNYFPNRIKKYFVKYGYKTIEKNTRAHLVNWLHSETQKKPSSYCAAGLMKFGPGVLSDEELARLAGKFTVENEGSYAFRKEGAPMPPPVDLINGEIDRRKRGLYTIVPGALVEVIKKGVTSYNVVIKSNGRTDQGNKIWTVTTKSVPTDISDEFITRIVDTIR